MGVVVETTHSITHMVSRWTIGIGLDKTQGCITSMVRAWGGSHRIGKEDTTICTTVAIFKVAVVSTEVESMGSTMRSV